MENVTPVFHYEPTHEDELNARRISACEKLEHEIKSIEDEQEEMKLYLNGIHFLSFDLKRQIDQQYDQKIRNKKSELEGIEETLLNDGINWRA